MHNHLDGTFLDADGRPRTLPSAIPALADEPLRWRQLRRRTAFNLVLHYASVPLVGAAALAALIWGPGRADGVWVPMASLILSLAFGAQIAVLLLTRRVDGTVDRAMAFASANTVLMLLAEATLCSTALGVWFARPETTDPLLLGVAFAAAGAAVHDALAMRHWMTWLHWWRAGMFRST